MTATTRHQPIVCHADGRVTLTLTHAQLLTLETWAAQPKWEQAKDEAVEVLRQLRL